MLRSLRVRLAVRFALTMLAVIAGAGYFIEQLAITESARMRVVFAAAATRDAMVFVLTLHVLSSMVREFNDKVMELILSRPLRRSSYFFGKLAGYSLVGIVLALLFSLPLALFAPLKGLGFWGVSAAASVSLGPLIGGYLIDHLDWQSIFDVNVPVGLFGRPRKIASAPRRSARASRWSPTASSIRISSARRPPSPGCATASASTPPPRWNR